MSIGVIIKINKTQKHEYFYRPWGSFENLKTDKNWHIKIIDVLKGKRLSLQSHKLRDELWVVLEGEGVLLRLKI